MSKFWSHRVHQLVPYVPGEQPVSQGELVKLNTNENPYPPSPKAIAAIANAAEDSLRLYPDPDAVALKQAIAKHYQVEFNQVFVGNGSDEVLAHAFYAFFQSNAPILFPDISYSFYPVYCNLYNIEYTQVPLSEDFSLNVADYDKENGGIIFPNPNAPTGIALSVEAIHKLLEKNTDSVVIIDEAYIDFGGQSAIQLIKQFPNLLVIQTLSKSRSLAGLRVGFAIGHADLIEGLERVKNSFNSYPLARTSIAGAIASIEDEAYFSQCTESIISDREKLKQSLEALGFNVLPSQANFVFARHPDYSGKALSAALREHDIIVRHFNGQRVADYLRITIATEREHRRLLDALSSILTTG